MKKPLIKYNLFQSRKKFNPVLLFKKDPDITYEKFVSYLNSKQVDSPGEDYFNRVRDHFKSLEKEVESDVEKTNPEVDKPEVISTDESTNDVKPVIARKKSRSKNRKKSEDEKENISKEADLKRDLSN